MFRVYHPERNNQVFTQIDPRQEGCSGQVEDDVSLDYSESVHLHPHGEATPQPVIGRVGPGAYKVFKYDHQREQAGAPLVNGNVVTCYSWGDYLEGRLAWYDNSRHE